MKGLKSLLVLFVLGCIVFVTFKVMITEAEGNGILLCLGIIVAIVWGVGGSFKNAHDDKVAGIYRTYRDPEAQERYDKARQAIFDKYDKPFDRSSPDYVNCQNDLAELRKKLRLGPPGENW